MATYYSFHYKTGSRATQETLRGNLNVRAILEFAYRLARVKGKSILVREHHVSGGWDNADMASDYATVEPNGNISGLLRY